MWANGKWRLKAVNRNGVPRFEVVPKRWIVERTLAWIGHFCRLARVFRHRARFHSPYHAALTNPLSFTFQTFRTGSWTQ